MSLFFYLFIIFNVNETILRKMGNLDKLLPTITAKLSQ